MAAVQDPPGRNSSASPDGVAVNKGCDRQDVYSFPMGALIKPRVSRAVDSKRELYVAHIVLGGIGLHLETKFPAHLQHHRVFLQNVP